MTSYSKYSYSQLEKMKASRIDSLIRSYHPNTNDLSETIKALNDYKEVVEEIRRRELKVKEIKEAVRTGGYGQRGEMGIDQGVSRKD